MTTYNMPKKGSKTRAVLDLLLLHYNTTNPRVNPSMLMGHSNTHRFGACIHRLRHEYGYNIATYKVSTTLFEYELLSTTPDNSLITSNSNSYNNSYNNNSKSNSISNSNYNNHNQLVQLSLLDCL